MSSTVSHNQTSTATSPNMNNPHQDDLDAETEWIPLNTTTTSCSSSSSSSTNTQNKNTATVTNQVHIAGPIPSANVRTNSSRNTAQQEKSSFPSYNKKSNNSNRRNTTPSSSNSGGGSSNPKSNEYDILKENLMNRPLSQFGIRFFIHFAREFWSYHVILRIGLVSIALAILSYLLSMTLLFFMTMYNLPRIILTTTIVSILTYLYIFQIDYENTKRRWEFIQKFFQDGVLNAMFLILESANGESLRWIVLFVTMVFPTLLEMLAITFLAEIVSESGFSYDHTSGNGGVGGTPVITGYSTCWKLLFLELCVLIPIHFSVLWGKDAADYSTTTTSTSRQGENNITAETGRRKPTALNVWGKIVIVKKDTTTLFEYRIHVWLYLYVSALLVAVYVIRRDYLLRPIALVGPFLLASGVILLFTYCQHRDDNNESVISIIVRRAIRLALIDVLEKVGENVAENEMLKLAMLRWIVDYWASTPRPSAPSNTDGNSQDSGGGTDRMGNNAGPSAKNENIKEEGGIGWRSLATMLAMTTAQMQSEVPQGQSQGNHNVSLDNLQSMLSSLDVDDRAEPAVEAYKNAVEEFPPSRRVALTLALMRRCPAMVSVICYYYSFSMYSNHIALTLIPMMLLEIMRVVQWSNSCQHAMIDETTKNDHERTKILMIPETMDPMEILLSEDDYSLEKRGTSLQVWTNVKDSVCALESGLTAMRCVQTAQVATDIAFDVMALTKIASEVREQGLTHGLAILALDVWKFHHQRSSADFEQNTGGRSNREQRGYTDTAVNIVENGQILARNINSLMEDENQKAGPLAPIIDGVAAIFGRGWLWGKDEDGPKENENARPQTGDENEATADGSSTKSVGTENNNEINDETIESDSKSEDTNDNKTANIHQEDIKISAREVQSENNLMEANIGVVEDLHLDEIIDDPQQTTPDETDNIHSISDDDIGVAEDLHLDETVSDPQQTTSEKAENDHDNDSDDESWTEIDPQNSVGTRDVSTNTARNVVNIGGEINDGVANEGDDKLKAIGAGLALLGTVIGGIALASSNQRESDRNQRGARDQSRRSTVYIERLDSDDDN